MENAQPHMPTNGKPGRAKESEDKREAVNLTEKQIAVVDKVAAACVETKLSVCDAYDVTVELSAKLDTANARLKRTHENAIEASNRYRNTLKQIAASYGIAPDDPSWAYHEQGHEFVQS